MDITDSSSDESVSDFSYDSCDPPTLSPFTSDSNVSEDDSNDDQIPQNLLPSCDTASIPCIENRVVSSECCLNLPQSSDSVATHIACKTYSLMGDNLDTNVKPRYKRTDHLGESLHYFHCLAIKDRISLFSQLAITPQHTCINRPQEMALQLLPTTESDSDLIDVMTMVISRVLATHLSYFQFSCSDVVTWHKDHQYYKEMSTKSDVVCRHEM